MRLQDIQAGERYANKHGKVREIESVRYWYHKGRPVYHSASSTVTYWTLDSDGQRVKRETSTLRAFAGWAVSRFEEAKEQPSQEGT